MSGIRGTDSPPEPCPRCSGYIAPDAGVRTLDSARGGLVCSACAWHETWLSASGMALPATWPVDVPPRFYGAIGSC